MAMILTPGYGQRQCAYKVHHQFFLYFLTTNLYYMMLTCHCNALLTIHDSITSIQHTPTTNNMPMHQQLSLCSTHQTKACPLGHTSGVWCLFPPFPPLKYQKCVLSGAFLVFGGCSCPSTVRRPLPLGTLSFHPSTSLLHWGYVTHSIFHFSPSLVAVLPPSDHCCVSLQPLLYSCHVTYAYQLLT